MNGSNLNTHKVKIKTKKFGEKIAKQIFNKSLKKYKCIGEKKKLKELKIQIKQQTKIVNQCDREDYKYGSENKTLKELLKIIKEENKENVIDFIEELFPFTGIKGMSTVTQSHVFEALWNLIFIFQKDNLKSQNETREFYKKLETMEKETKDINTILNKSKIHESNKSGIADTFFEHIQIDLNRCPKCGLIINPLEKEKHEKECKVVQCTFNKGNTSETKNIKIPSCNENNSIKDTSKKFIFSAKYFKKEKPISSYDIQNIFIEAESKLNDFNIILLVKDKEDFDFRVSGTNKIHAKRFKDRYDIKDLDIFYKDLLNDLLHNDIDKYIRTFQDKKDLKILIPRFHQDFFINYSIENIIRNNLKLVWGAVPRSGKSYMIGGLISKLYREKIRPIKNVIVILGAVSETSNQFLEMFEEYSDFANFNKISIQEQDSTTKYDNIDPNTSNIILISQQQLWYNTKKPETIHPKLTTIFHRKDSLVFFDEIHQGSSPKANAQMNVLTSLIFHNDTIDYPFVMVTATFAKPLKRYLTLGSQETKLIQWRYEDIQYMKEIDNEDIYNKLLLELQNTEETSDIVKKSEILSTLFETYNNKGITKSHLAKEYIKYPRLTIISPNLEDISFINDENKTDIDERIISKTDLERDVICNIFKSTKDNFNNVGYVTELLNYIKIEIYANLLQKRLKFNVFGRKHTQLWFLPTVCSSSQTNEVKRLNKKLKSLKKDKTSKDKNKAEIIRITKELEEAKENSNNITIEKMTRFLSLLMMKDKDFRENFCVLVIHSTMGNAGLKEMNMEPFKSHTKSGSIYKYKDINVTTFTNLDNKGMPCISTQCVGNNKLGKCIERQEACAHAQNKSVIILTGMRLRLGISLPCVDIALHMDPISSVDTIYQSMFRVLTERKGKETGYFIDLLSERFVNFIYEYDDYTNKSKKNIDLESRKTNIIEKLYSFNLNGINLVENKKFGKIYSKLSENLGLNNDIEFNKRTTLLEESNISNMLSDLEESNKSLFNEFYQRIKMLNIDYSKKSLKDLTNMNETLVERRKKSKKSIYNSNNNNNNNNRNELQEKTTKEETSESKYTKMTNYIKDIFSLVNLFEEEILDNPLLNCNPHDIKIQLLDKLKYDLTSRDINDSLCKKDNRILDCHFSYIKNMKLNDITLTEENKQKMALIINIFRHNLLYFINQLKETDVLELFKYFCTIRDSFVFLKKNIDNQSSIMSKRCNPPSLSKLNGGGRKKKQSSQLIENETVLETIRKYLSVRDEEKKLFGEVFTPIELVCEMLEKLPVGQWKEPKLKWLDPANGIGNYPVVAYYKLMEGLKDVKGYENKTVRSKHIIENMLFMVELNPINVKVCRKIFKMIDSNAEPNIYNSPFYTDSESNLTENWTSKCKIKIPTLKFDIIMGNPPYNQGGIRSKSGTGGENTKTIWPLFIENSLNILNKNGYLIFITPSTWTELNSGNNNISGKMINLQIEYLKCYNYASSLEKFGGGAGKIPLSYYLLKNINTKNDTLIWDDNHTKFIKFNIYKTNFIPNFNVSIISKILKKSIFNYNYKKSSRINSVDLNNTYSTIHKFPIIHYAKHNLLLKYSKKCGQINIIKLVLPNSSMGYPIIDNFGIINCEKADSYNIIHDDIKILKKIQLFLLSSLGCLLINSLKTRMNFFSNRIFEILPDVSKLDFEITDKNLNKYFEFDEMDIKAIEQQKTSGEGNLTDRQKQEIINFNIEKYVSKDQIKFIKDSIDKECPKSSKKSKKNSIRNNANNRQSKKANNVEPDYMRDCPQKILDRSEPYQVIKEECLRYNEDPNHPLKKSKKKKKKFKVKSKSK